MLGNEGFLGCKLIYLVNLCGLGIVFNYGLGVMLVCWRMGIRWLFGFKVKVVLIVLIDLWIDMVVVNSSFVFCFL